MKLVFIASPFRASTAWRIARNVRRAEELALSVWQAGACAVCPHSMSALFHGEGPEERYLAGWLAMLERCDAVFLGDRSSGVETEVARAKELGLPVFRSVEELRAWV